MSDEIFPAGMPDLIQLVNDRPSIISDPVMLYMIAFLCRLQDSITGIPVRGERQADRTGIYKMDAFPSLFQRLVCMPHTYQLSVTITEQLFDFLFLHFRN